MLKTIIIGMVLTTGFPIKGTLTSKFGPRVNSAGKKSQHQGIDIGAPIGTVVRVPADGTVERVGPSGAYGRLVVVRHSETLTTRYAHLSAIFVYEGEKIEKGELLGTVGETGRATGPHLHFEIRQNGKPVDPMKFYLTEGVVLRKR